MKHLRKLLALLLTLAMVLSLLPGAVRAAEGEAPAAPDSASAEVAEPAAAGDVAINAANFPRRQLPLLRLLEL